jgi:hypothetical protein
MRLDGRYGRNLARFVLNKFAMHTPPTGHANMSRTLPLSLRWVMFLLGTFLAAALVSLPAWRCGPCSPADWEASSPETTVRFRTAPSDSGQPAARRIVLPLRSRLPLA